jgi:flagellin
MDRISDIREELGITERRLYHVVDDLSMQRMNLLSAKSTLADANMAVEAASLAKQQILNDATTAVKAQGDPFMQSILDLEQEHNVGHQAIRTLGGQ